MNKSKNSSNSVDSISLMDIFIVIAKHLKVIIIVPFIICSISIIHVSFYTTSIFESNAKIMSSSGTSGVGISQAVGGLAAQFGINLSNSQNGPQWVYSDIINSRTLAKALLKRKFDTELLGKDKSLFQILTSDNINIDIKNAKLSELETKAIDNILDMINFKENLNTGVHSLSIKATEPVFASHLVSALIEELDNHLKEFNSSKINKAREFIEERLYDTKIELEKAEEALKVFRDRNRRIQNSPNLLLQEQRLLREVSVLTGVFTTLKQQYETTKIEAVKDSDYVIVIDPPEVPLERIYPRKKYIVIVNGFIGIGLGLFLAFLIEYINNLTKSERDKMTKILSIIIANFNFFKKKSSI